MRLFTGHMAAPGPGLDAQWQARLKGLRDVAARVVLVALGTFLSARDDVLRTVVEGVLTGLPDTAVVVAAGERTAALADLAGDRAVVVPSVPQQALLEHVDAMVHHGGGNSFTECLRAGVPALLLPFSSDQFSVAYDAQRSGAGVVRDPNTLAPDDVPTALQTLWAKAGPRLPGLSAQVRERGPGWAAGELLATMGRRAEVCRSARGDRGRTGR